MSLDNIPVPDTELDRLLIDFKFRRYRRHLHGRILDVGCGVGVMTKMLHDSGYEVEGLDGSEKRIEEARRYVPEVTFHTAMFKDFKPEKRDLYNTIILSSVLEHLSPRKGDDLLRRCRGWLKPKGTIVVAVPNKNAFHKRLYGITGLTTGDHLVGHKRTYDYVELNQQVVKAGFFTNVMGGVVIKPASNNMMSDVTRSDLERWFMISDLEDTFHLASVVYVVAKK